MNKTSKIFICLFFIFSCFLFFGNSFAKYVMENTYVVATLNIDRCPPIIELIDIKTSNTSNPNYITKKNSVSGHFRVNEKNIFSNSVSVKNFTIFVNENQIKTAFTTLTLSSETPEGPIYEFYFTNITGDGALTIVIPEGTIRDTSGLTNAKTTFYTNFIVNNTNSISNFSNSSQQSSVSSLNNSLEVLPSQNSNNLHEKDSFIKNSENADDTSNTQISENFDDIYNVDDVVDDIADDVTDDVVDCDVSTISTSDILSDFQTNQNIANNSDIATTTDDDADNNSIIETFIKRPEFFKMSLPLNREDSSNS